MKSNHWEKTFGGKYTLYTPKVKQTQEYHLGQKETHTHIRGFKGIKDTNNCKFRCFLSACYLEYDWGKK